MYVVKWFKSLLVLAFLCSIGVSPVYSQAFDDLGVDSGLTDNDIEQLTDIVGDVNLNCFDLSLMLGDHSNVRADSDPDESSELEGNSDSRADSDSAWMQFREWYVDRLLNVVDGFLWLCKPMLENSNLR